LFVLSFVPVPTFLRGNHYPRLKFRRRAAMKHESGFTLLELLLVIALLSVTAGVVVQGYEGVQDLGRYDAARFEMAELRKALLQFRRDSGTNDFSGQGIYDCTDAANDNPAGVNPDMDFPAEAGTTDAEKIAWCQSPANFWMLFTDPFGRSQEAQWNPDTHRGWHGPYLQRKSGLISYGNVDDVWGIADPYQSPFILMGNDDEAHIVSFGPDKTHGGEDAIPCEPSAGSDDTVLCLLQ
jgi:prepilin-type N-terminal cleavage/methylation domain-containing protein